MKRPHYRSTVIKPGIVTVLLASLVATMGVKFAEPTPAQSLPLEELTAVIGTSSDPINSLSDAREALRKSETATADGPRISNWEIIERRRQHTKTTSAADLLRGNRQEPRSTPRRLEDDSFDFCRQYDVTNPDYGYIVNQYVFCNHQTVVMGYQTPDGKIVGYWAWRSTTVGLTEPEQRQADIRFELANFRSGGQAAANPAIRLGMLCYVIESDSDQNHPEWCEEEDPAPVSRTVSQWRASPYAEFSMSSRGDVGIGPEKIVLTQLTPYVVSPGTPYGYLWNQLVRHDSAEYLQRPPGAIFSNLIWGLIFNRGNSNISQIAEHVWDACNVPDQTVPADGAGVKDIPGCTPQEPMYRLYHDDQRRTDNRNSAKRACRNNFDMTGASCDEFPFSSTYEGAAQSEYEEDVFPNQFSVRAVAPAQNSRQGDIIREFYSKQRILDEPATDSLVLDDPFWSEAQYLNQ